MHIYKYVRRSFFIQLQRERKQWDKEQSKLMTVIELQQHELQAHASTVLQFHYKRYLTEITGEDARSRREPVRSLRLL